MMPLASRKGRGMMRLLLILLMLSGCAHRDDMGDAMGRAIAEELGE